MEKDRKLKQCELKASLLIKIVQNHSNSAQIENNKLIIKLC